MGDASSTPRTSPGARLSVVLILLSLASLLNLFYRASFISPGVAQRAECARLILEGKLPYVGFLTMDSPTALFLSVPPVWISKMMPVSIVHCTLAWDWLLVFGPLFLSLVLLREARRLPNSLWCSGLLIAYAALGCCLVFQFGETEHLLVAFTFPYLLSRWLEYSGRAVRPTLAMSAGLLAGIAACLDPYFWMVPILLELGLLLQIRRLPCLFPLALLAAIVVQVGVKAALFLMSPEMVNAYSDYVLPLILVDRSTFDMRIYGYLSCPDGRWLVYLLALATVLSIGNKRVTHLSGVVVALGWLGFLYYVLESKGYTYQAIPVIWSSVTVLAIQLSYWLRVLCRFARSRSDRFSFRPMVMTNCFLVLAIGLSFTLQENQVTLAATAEQRLSPLEPELFELVMGTIEKNADPGAPVLVINGEMSPAYPVLLEKRFKPGSRQVWIFAPRILALMRDKENFDKSDLPILESLYLGGLKQDIETIRPQVILLHQGPENKLLAEYGIMKLISRLYKERDLAARFYSDNVSPREFSSFNYNFTVFLLRDASGMEPE